MIKNILLVVILFFGASYVSAQLSPVEMGEKIEKENEILSVKCSQKMLPYIINHLYNYGFRIVSMSCNEPVEPIWVINYVSMQ